MLASEAPASPFPCLAAFGDLDMKSPHPPTDSPYEASAYSFPTSVVGEEDPGASLDLVVEVPSAPQPVPLQEPASFSRGVVDAPSAETRPTADTAGESSPQSLFRLGLVAGACASLASTVALAWAGWRHTGSCSAATNATSHWLWGDKAFAQRDPSWQHTGLGYLIHHSTATFWAFLYAWAEGARLRGQRPLVRLISAGIAAATACAVDYTITPKRLTPGFEVHLSRRSMTGVYALFALGLAVGCWWAERQARR